MSRLLEALIVLGCVAPFIYFLTRGIRERARFRHQFDGVRMGSPETNTTVEVVDPPFWKIGRLWKKRKATVLVDFMMKDATGKDRLLRLRARVVKNPSDMCPLCKRPYRHLP